MSRPEEWQLNPVLMMMLLVVATAALVLLASFMPAVRPADGQAAGGKVIVEPRDGSHHHSPPPPPCRVSITSMKISSLKWNGHERNNPDGTYYPGDAFRFSVGINEEHCTDVRVTITGDRGLDIAACDDCTSARIYISGSASPGTYTVRATVRGEGSGGEDSDRESTRIRVIDPMITVRVTPANVTDRDGYLMRNADDTYYINDAVALKYEVDYRFKGERLGIIEPEVTRTHPYLRIADLDCLHESCTLAVPATAATSEYRAQYTYGTGISVANATASQGGPGQKAFRFDVKLKNAGAYTDMQASHTHMASIVDYRPVFAAVYPYLGLKDGGERSYEKNLVIGLHYLGSADPGGKVEPLRRAKINLYTNTVSALVLGTNSTDVTEQTGLTWLSTSMYVPSQAAARQIINDDRDPAVVTAKQQGKNAMIEREGYVKITMKMEKYRPEAFAEMQDLTAFPAFYSKDFAGKAITELFAANYTYPDTYFTNTIIVKVLGGEGSSVDEDRAVRVSMRPAAGATTTMCDYYKGHALSATAGDAVFAEMVLSDVYACAERSFVKSGGVVEVRANMTGLLIPEVYYELLYPGGISTIPPHVALESPSSTELALTITSTGISKTYERILYAHDVDAEIVANVGQGNTLGVERNDGASVTVKSPANFGPIVELRVNGGAITQACPVQCTLNIPGPATIVATNEWGGMATAVVDAPGQADSTASRIPAVLTENNGQNVILAILGAIGAAVVGIAFRKYVLWLGDALS